MNKTISQSVPWSICFAVGAVLFSSHAGGGFATGNQENVYYVALGWLGPISAIFTMLLLTFTIKEAMFMYNSRKLKGYKELFHNLYSPAKGIVYFFELFFYIMVLMAVSAAVSGAATALQHYIGIPYAPAVVLVGATIFSLTIFGANLVRKATSYMGIAILVCVVVIFATGIVMAGDIPGTMRVWDVIVQDYATNGWSKFPQAVLNAFTYSGFQCVVIPTMIAVGSVLRTRKDCARSMWMSFGMNAVALTLAVTMLMGWSSFYGKSALPTLTSAQAMGMPWLTIVYSVFLIVCLVSTGITTVFGFTARFSEAEFVKKISPNAVVRSAIVTLFIITLSMSVSMVGLTNIIKYGYGYCGYLAIAIIIVPFLTVGVYKNRRYMNDAEYRARIDVMNGIEGEEQVEVVKDGVVA